MSCKLRDLTGDLPAHFLEENLKKFEKDISKWVACLASSRWMSVQLIEKWVNRTAFCYPIAWIQIDNKNLVWSLRAGNPVERSFCLEPNFTRQVIFGRNSEEESSDEDSGSDDTPNLVKSAVQDRHLDWITNMINWSEKVEKELDPQMKEPTYTEYVITMTKALECEEKTCMKHVSWYVNLEMVKEEKRLYDLVDEDGLLVAIERWVKMIQGQHFPTVSGSSLRKVVCGNRHLNL